MKNFILTLSLLSLFAAIKISAQTCNNLLSVTVSGITNSSSCTPCNGQATANATGATGYVWSNGQTTSTATGLCAGTYTVYAYDASFNCGSKTVTITCPNGIHENETTRFIKLFPNPASENIFVELLVPNNGAVTGISVFNTMGEAVLNKSFNNARSFTGLLNIGTLPKGIYFIEMRDEKYTYRNKFIKQ